MTATEAESLQDLQQYGGQAVIEGVMMRSLHYYAVACRKPDGEIVTHCEHVDHTLLKRFKWLNFPFGRGTLGLLDAMILGAKALQYASNVQIPQNQNEKDSATRISEIAVGSTLVVSLIIAVIIFKLVPTLITYFLHKHGFIAQNTSGHMLNLIDGLIRITFFFGYIFLISRIENIKRVFMYHGAEHKAINTLEARKPLDTVHTMKASRIHPRCGTSFIFVVLLLDLIAVVILPRPENILLRFLLQVAVVPFVAGIAYEAIKLAGKYRKNPLVMAVFAPGMATQYLTTREPDLDQVEVAIAALKEVRTAEAAYKKGLGSETSTENANIVVTG